LESPLSLSPHHTHSPHGTTGRGRGLEAPLSLSSTSPSPPMAPLEEAAGWKLPHSQRSVSSLFSASPAFLWWQCGSTVAHDQAARRGHRGWSSIRRGAARFNDEKADSSEVEINLARRSPNPVR